MLVGGSEKSAIMTKSKDITGSDVMLINESPTGLFENRKVLNRYDLANGVHCEAIKLDLRMNHLVVRSQDRTTKIHLSGALIMVEPLKYQ